MVTLRAFFRDDAAGLDGEWAIIAALVFVALISGLSAVSSDLKPIFIDMGQGAVAR